MRHNCLQSSQDKSKQVSNIGRLTMPNCAEFKSIESIDMSMMNLIAIAFAYPESNATKNAEMKMG